MRKDSFYKESLILIVSNLGTGILGFMFSIMLSKELGPEGMGLYGLIMPIYNLFICLICGGMVTAISKVASVYYSKNDYKNLNKTIETSLKFDFIWALFVAVLFFLASSFISSFIIKDSRTLYALKSISPALIFVGLSSILKGYFYGISKVKIPAIIDIIEKAFRIALIVAAMNMLKTATLTKTVTIAYIVLALGECLSLIILFVFYRLNKHKSNYSNIKREGRSQLLFNVLVVSLPLCLNGFLSTALGTASTLIVPRRLISTGIEYSSALSMIGKFSGMAMAIIFFPLIVVNSISTVLIPDLSQTLEKKDYFALEDRIISVIRITFILGLATLIICTSIPNSLGKLFFDRADLGNYIRFAALAAPITFVASTTFGILNGLGKQGIVLRNSLIVSSIEVILLYVLTGINRINIYGFGITLIITSIVLFILNIHEIKKFCYLVIPKTELTIYILVSILLFFILSIVNSMLPNTLMSLKTILLIAFGYSTFFFISSLIKKES